MKHPRNFELGQISALNLVKLASNLQLRHCLVPILLGPCISMLLERAQETQGSGHYHKILQSASIADVIAEFNSGNTGMKTQA